MVKRLLPLLLAVAVPFFLCEGQAMASFGFLPGSEGFDLTITNKDGSPDTQAGSHPYQVTSSFSLKTTTIDGQRTIDGGYPKDVHVELPPGLVGDVNAVPQCTEAEFAAPYPTNCPPNTVVGVGEVTLLPGGGTDTFPIYNLVPPTGVPAEFGFPVLSSARVLLNASVRTGSDNGVTVGASNINQTVAVSHVALTFWGVPADPSHDALRCADIRESTSPFLPIPCSADVPSPTAFLTLPTSCGGALTTTIRADSWDAPGSFVSASSSMHDGGGNPLGLDGCNALGFDPAISVAPDTSYADTPTGLTVEVKPPQDGLLNPSGLVQSNVQNTRVVLPAGVVINPGQAAGLTACQSFQDGVGTEGPPSCPVSSKVGTVQITTPLLPDKLEGTVYVLQSNPPNLELLVAASADGVNIKLVGDVHLDGATGQLTSTFSGTPQLPFSDFKLSFSGGAQAALVTPPTCGVYGTSADFTPWASPFLGDALSTNSFAIGNGPGGGGCASPLPFSPSLTAGATTDQAGGFTDFSLLLSRGDGQQRIAGLQFNTPPGLLGMISNVSLCGEPQAAAGACPASSQIGETIVGAGPGPFPLFVPGPGAPQAPIYLTGPYKGAPYGLSIVVPVIAGPFNLGTIVVRAAISVDPHTTALTISTDPLPQVVAGVPTDLRLIDAVVNRPSFMFNPTNCSPMAFSGTATSAQGATAALSSHFQVGSCRSLAFKPTFKVAVSGKTSKRNGASLDAKVIYPPAPVGADQATAQANIAKVKVDLPKQLPSRLTTLQKACLSATFEANPARCPAESRVGFARAISPVLREPLLGPAYFISHGGEAFPNLTVVLQGDGVRVDLVGTTFINSKTGITSSTFGSVPDVPVTSFELYLPQGPYSALTTDGNLCKGKLVMPTVFTAQNGAVMRKSTAITVTGCPKAKKTKSKKKPKKAKQATQVRRAGKHTNGGAQS